MTATAEFFCDFCNPGKDRDHPTGYAAEIFPGQPLGWWPWPRNDPAGEGHACPTCIIERASVRETVHAARQAEFERAVDALSDDDGLKPGGPTPVRP